MATVTRTFIAADGNTLTAAIWNNEFNNLLNALALVNADISAGANIAPSKIAGTAAVLSGNTFTGKNTFANTVQTITSYTPSSGGTVAIDLSVGNVHHITMPAGNITITVSNGSVGQFFLIRVLQDSVGSRTISWFSTIKWSGGSAPTSSGANKVDTMVFEVVSSGNYDGTAAITNAS